MDGQKLSFFLLYHIPYCSKFLFEINSLHRIYPRDVGKSHARDRARVISRALGNPLIRLYLGTRADFAGFEAKSSTDHGEIAPLSRAYFDEEHNAFKLQKFAFAKMALHAHVLPVLAGSLSSALWAKQMAWMKRSCQQRRRMRSLGQMPLDLSMNKPGKACAWHMRKL
jgi:hypothetical protein